MSYHIIRETGHGGYWHSVVCGKEMIWCSICAKNSNTHLDHITLCCVDCGKVLFEDKYIEDDTYADNLVTMQSACSKSHTRALNEGNAVIYDLINEYGITKVSYHATEYYEKAVESGFTRGRKTELVAVACLYAACREMKKPVLLIEFSSNLNLYELGIVYLQLCKLLGRQDHPVVQKPVDPSFFMHRYTSVLSAANSDGIDDSEVCGYLLDVEESCFKVTWEHMLENREYIQEEAAAADAYKLYMGNSEALAAQVDASKKEKAKRKRESVANPAQTAAGAASPHFKKRLSLKINYDAVARIFGDEEQSLEKNVDDGGNAKGNEIRSKDNIDSGNDEDNNDSYDDDDVADDDDDDEWKYADEQQMSGNGDDYDQDNIGSSAYESWL